MAGKTLPWWRKALNFAILEIRSRLGLLSRPVKADISREAEPTAPSPETPEKETAWKKKKTVVTEQVQNPAIEQEIAAPAADVGVVPEIVHSAEPEGSSIPAPVREPEPGQPPAHEPDRAPEPPTKDPDPAEPPVHEPEPEPEDAPSPIKAAEPEPEIPAGAGTEALGEMAATPVASAVAETAAPAEVETFATESAAKAEAIVAPENLTDEVVEGQAAEPVPAGEDLASPAAEQPAPPAAVQVPVAKEAVKPRKQQEENDLSPFSVLVGQVYDGPLDLLLDLIRKQDIDIYDIPIAQITAQFLNYVNHLKASDVDVAGEFIYTASLLIHIKSKMLLPRAPSGPDDASEDPRRELVERLLEHERFKNAAQMLQQKQMLEAATWSNPGVREFKNDAAAEPEIAADTTDLVRIFRDILERARKRPVFSVDEDQVTVGQMIQFLARRLTMEDKPVALRRLLSHTRSERALIAMFLALLELVRLQAILLRQDRAFSEIFIKKNIAFETVMTERVNDAGDEWR